MEHYWTKTQTSVGPLLPSSKLDHVTEFLGAEFTRALPHASVPSSSSDITFADSLIVRAWIAYSFYLIEEEIPEYEKEDGEESFLELLHNQVAKCYLLSGFFISCKKVDRTLLAGNPQLSQLIRCACVKYMNSVDPWILERPSALILSLWV